MEVQLWYIVLELLGSFIIIQNILSNRNVTNKMRMNRGNYLQEWTGITNLFGWRNPLIKVKVGEDAMLFYFELVVILLCTKLAGDISVRLGQPSVLGKLIVGIIIGPAVLGIINSSELIDELSEIGVLLLMFMADLKQI